MSSVLGSAGSPSRIPWLCRKAAQRPQPVLFELKDDTRPKSEQTIAGRFSEPTSLVRTKRQSIFVPFQRPRRKMRGSFYQKVMIAHRSAPCFMPSTLAHSGLRLNWLYVHVTVPTTKKGTLYDNRPKSCRLQLRYRMGQRTETPPIFDQGISLAQRLNQQATEASRAAWAVEMRLRAVRLAETEKEKADAIAALTDIVRRYDLAVAAE